MKRRNRMVLVARRLVLAPLAALVLVAVAPEANSAAGTPITSCEQVVTTNAFLTQNLDCVYANGVVVGASGITVDLKGFTLRGNLSGAGVRVAGFDGVTVKNGVVRTFLRGVEGDGANKLSVVNVLAIGNSVGIYVSGSSATVKSSSALGNQAAVSVYGDAATISSSTASGNGSGFLVQGAGATISKSVATGNGGDGIVTFGDAPVVTGNRAEGNGFYGGASDLGGLGIVALSYTTAPIGKKNIARGNDDPAECDPAYLC